MAAKMWNSEREKLKIIHSLPGRIRLRLAVRYGCDEMEKLKCSLYRQPGILHVHQAGKTGNWLVFYDIHVVVEKDIINSIIAYLDENVAVSSDSVSVLDCHSSNGAILSSGYAGLTTREAHLKLEQHGPNLLPDPPKPGIFRMFTMQFDNTLAKILLASSIVSILSRNFADAFSVIGIATINAAFGVYQEKNADKAVKALNFYIVPDALVIRDGLTVKLPASQFVPGDLVLLERGNISPADVILLKADNLSVVESALTGESYPVAKTQVVDFNNAAKENMVFQGTNISSGRAFGIVVATGRDTQFGRISSAVHKSGRVFPGVPPEIEDISGAFIKLSILAGTIAFQAGVWRRMPVTASLISALALAVSAIPEGLPTMVNIAQFSGMRVLARKKAIVKKLQAILDIGGVSVICMDKTGTLTQNEQTVQYVYTGHSLWQYTGDPLYREQNPDLYDNLNEFFKCAVLCCGGEFVDGLENDALPDSFGEPMERALLSAAYKLGLDTKMIRKEYTKIKEMPFEPGKRHLTTVYQDDNNIYYFVKGSPETILDLCSSFYEKGQIVDLAFQDRTRIQSQIEYLSSNAYRLQALGQKKCFINDDQNNEGAESGFTFLGIVAFYDPPRKDAKNIISICQQAGIKTVILSGDYAGTTGAIAREVGISNSRVMRGKDIDMADTFKIGRAAGEVSVFAELLPEHKQKIVQAFRQNNEIVAMVGDGMNDAPGMASADVGVAMGSGTDVTKHIADIVITDDSLEVMADILMQGQNVRGNVKRTIRYLTAANVAELMIPLMLTLFSGNITFLPVQLFLLNLIVDIWPALALATVSPERNTIAHSGKTKKLVDGQTLKSAVSQGVLIGLSGLGAYKIISNYGNASRSQTSVIATVTLSQLLYALKCNETSNNKALGISAGLSLAMLLGAIYIPFLHRFLKTTPLMPGDWLFIILASVFTNQAGKIFGNLSPQPSTP